MELKFRLSKKNKENLFGLIVNSTNYSAWRSNKKLSYMGYFVGFDNGLLVIDYCMYNRCRIYDKPYRITPGKNYKLRVEVVDNMIYVYVNDISILLVIRGLCILSIPLFIINKLFIECIGYGDLQLMSVLGMMLGDHIYYMFMIASLIASSHIFIYKFKNVKIMPFVPYLACSTYLILLF
jgi:hypothetical protein